MVSVIVVVRPPLFRRLLVPVGLAVVVALVAGAGVGGGGPLLLAVLPVTVAAVVAGVRAWALRVEAHAERLVLVNWSVTVRMPWAEVARCGADERGLYVWRADGHEFRSSAFPRGTGAARAAAAELEGLRRARG